MSALLFDPPATVGLDALEDELTRAFAIVRSALQRGDAVVVRLDERDVQGAGDPAAAAFAHGLLGLVRALAFEGRAAGWRINALALPRDLPPAEGAAWIERLSDPQGASGALVRLGDEHLGRVPA